MSIASPAIGEAATAALTPAPAALRTPPRRTGISRADRIPAPEQR